MLASVAELSWSWKLFAKQATHSSRYREHITCCTFKRSRNEGVEGKEEEDEEEKMEKAQ